MKKIIILLFISCAINAQSKKEYKHSLEGVKKVQIETDTSAKIIAGNTKELIIKNLYPCEIGDCDDYNETRNDKAKGLTAIYPDGKDNTGGFGLSIKLEGDILIVRDLKSHFQRKGITITLPKSMNVSIDCGNLGNLTLEGFSSEIEADTNVGSINMKNITGPITAHTNVGAINIDFITVSQSSPITISSNVSEIDISIPANTNASLELKTMGTIYTNFNLRAPSKKGLKNVGGTKKIMDNLNKGGVKITLRSSMGNIYLRKKE